MSKTIKIISKPIAAGKTYEVLKISEKHNSTIVCFNETSKAALLGMAKKMEIKIPTPITMEKFFDRSFPKGGHSSFVIDDIDRILYKFSSDRMVKAISLQGPILEEADRAGSTLNSKYRDILIDKLE